MTYARLLAVVLAFALPVASAAAGPAKPTCARELAVTETTLLKTLVRMQNLGKESPSEQCETYRAHAAVVTKAREVFGRCSTGAERERELGDMDGALDRAKSAIASTCATQ